MWTSAKGALNASFIALLIVHCATGVRDYREFDSVLKIKPKPIQANTQAPYYVNIRYGLDERICAGTIISPEWILTTGTCTLHKSSQAEPLVVSIDQLSPPVLRVVKRIEYYPGFEPPGNDVAMLQLTSPIQLNHEVTAIRVRNNLAPDIPSGQFVRAASLLVQPDKPDDLMQLVDMINLPKSICQAPEELPSYACAYPAKHSPGLCTHEAGGAIVYAGQLAGIGIEQDCRSEWFELYRDIRYFQWWIDELANPTNTNFLPVLAGQHNEVENAHSAEWNKVANVDRERIIY